MPRKRNYAGKEKRLFLPPHRIDPIWHLALRWNVPKGLAASTALCFLESQKRVIIGPFKPGDVVITVSG